MATISPRARLGLVHVVAERPFLPGLQWLRKCTPTQGMHSHVAPGFFLKNVLRRECHVPIMNRRSILRCR